jgi:hypothetical protein
MRHEKVAHAESAWLSFIGIVNVFQSDLDPTDADLERISEVDRREVDPPIQVDAATWSNAGRLDWWVKGTPATAGVVWTSSRC